MSGIFASISQIPKYVLDADIRKCFDKINHDALLAKLKAPPSLRRVIRGWLKAGVMDQGEFHDTFEGTPQGGVISPLLANIALHGLENLMADIPHSEGTNAPRLIRYADDFVILHPDLATIERTRNVVNDWLHRLGLELKDEKTQVTHTMTRHNGNVGFNFLGFTVRLYPTGKAHRLNRGNRGYSYFRPRISPSKDALKRHYSDLAEAIKEYQDDEQSELIRRLNPMILGWSNYYRHQVSKRAFNKMDHMLFYRLIRWARRRHPNKGDPWIIRKYWKTQEGWIFTSPAQRQLLSHSATQIVRFVKVAGMRSPFDGDWAYWASRLGHYPDLQPSVATLLRRQKGKCPWCTLYFRQGDVLERDHIVPTIQGGDNTINNRQLLHGHCHDQKTRIERSSGAQRTVGGHSGP
jgi:RNA-directed DNA polymerase